MLTFFKTVRATQLDMLNKPHSLADKIFHASTQLDKRNDPYQLDKLNKPHSLADEMFQTSTRLDKHNEPY